MLSDHRYTAIFGAALLTAGGATFAVYRMLGAAATPRHEPVRMVVVAVRDVPVGIPVPREALGVASWPVGVAPAESFTTADSVVGRVTRAPLMPGEPVLPSRLAVRGAAPGLEGAIDPARRAMAVRVNEAASLSGLVRANSRVDVLMAGRGDGAQINARVLMSDVRVLGVGSVRPPEPAGGGTGSPDPTPSATTAAIVTLEVTPAQAEQLAAAEGQGAIQVVLRGYGSAGDLRGAEPSRDLGAAAATGGAMMGPFGAAMSGGMSVAAGPARASAHIAPAPRAARRAPAGSGDVASSTGHHAAEGTRAHAESTVVYVYRGGAMTVLRLGRTEPGATTGSSTPVDADAGVRPVRTADVHVGPHAP